MKKDAAPDGEEQPKVDPPLYFAAAPAPGAKLDVVLEEVRMAAAVGIHRYMLSVPLSWSGQPSDLAPALDRLEALFMADPQARAILQVSVNPPASWLDEHASATVHVNGEKRPYPCVASQAWIRDACTALSLMGESIRDKFKFDQFEGCLLTGLEDGRWYLKDGPDTCQDNVSGFRQWLRLRYPNDDALRAAWGDPAATLDGASIPAPPEESDASFVTLPAGQPRVDFLQYTSDATAQAIGALAAHVKGFTGEEIRLIAPYGYTCELASNDSGHLALGKLLESSVDEIASPVSYLSRGLGGVGGYMGPVQSVLARGKQWLLIDDTRTGVGADASNGTTGSAAAGEIAQVQRRNFAAALANGMPLAWSDPEGTGWLRDSGMWERFGRMRQVYGEMIAASRKNEQSPVTLYAKPTLMLVVDEASRAYELSDDKLGAMLQQCQVTALRAGVPMQICLLQDVLKEKVPAAAVYWFVNAHRLTQEQRTSLHEILKREKAAAIWMYAPGYFGPDASVENVAATVRMGVKAAEGGGEAGSKFELAGIWAEKGEPFGGGGRWDPLLYVDDEKASVLARYADSEKPSVAIQYVEDGWKSVFVAEPGLSPGVLREILLLLEQRLFFRKTVPVAFDAAYFGPDMMAVHAGDPGDRAIDLGQVFDIEDAFDSQVGWPRSRLINLPMDSGETRVFRVKPANE